MTTAVKDEEELKYDLMEKFCDAMDAGDYENAKEICKDIVLLPETAMQMLRVMGKKQLLATQFDFSAANREFGGGWMDEQPKQLRVLR